MNMKQFCAILCQLLLFLLFSTCQSQLTSTEGLDPGEILNQCLISKFDKCYSFFNDNPVTYDAAKAECERFGGKLSSIPDQETQNFIESTFVTEKNEVPCRRHFPGSVFCRVWFDLFTKLQYSREFFTSTGNVTTYTHWEQTQPNLQGTRGRSGDASYCGSFKATDGLWYDDNCETDKNYFLCEVEGASCNVKDIQIPNALFDSCNENKNVSIHDRVNIRCKDGYELSGNETAVCMHGNWSELPSCQRICSPPVLSSHSSIYGSNNDSRYIVGKSELILCDPGYVMGTDPSRSHFVITCTAKSVWANVTECVPADKFQVMTMGIKYNAEIELDCQMPNESQPEDWLWQKNSLVINAEDGYLIDRKGTLQITNFQGFHEGVYTCLASPPRLALRVVSYNLKLQPVCINISDASAKKNVVEGHSLFINCPHVAIEGSTKSIKWLKDEKPFPQSERIFVVPDGTVIILQVNYSDRGIYSCDISWKSGLCTSRISTELTVAASAESICGNPSMMSSSPWTVSLYFEDEKTPFCYGALIQDNWVVTSAYCMSAFSRKKSFKIFVLFGKKLLDVEDSPGNGLSSKASNIRFVESMKLHPHYSPRLFANDVALVKLKQRISFSNDIQPICLTDKDLTKTVPCNADSLSEGLVSGWGYIDVDSTEDANFQTSKIFVANSKLCNTAAAAASVKYTDAIFCGTQNASEETIHAANFGSPFAIESEERVYLAGIFILGERYSHMGEYDYFTKISNYVSWIKTTIS